MCTGSTHSHLNPVAVHLFNFIFVLFKDSHKCVQNLDIAKIINTLGSTWPTTLVHMHMEPFCFIFLFCGCYTEALRFYGCFYLVFAEIRD